MINYQESIPSTLHALLAAATTLTARTTLTSRTTHCAQIMKTVADSFEDEFDFEREAGNLRACATSTNWDYGRWVQALLT